jgi:hypothetical protein
MKIAILDDYQNVATNFADWDSLDAEIVVFTKPFADAHEIVRRLAGFGVLVAMWERTRFPAEVLERLTDLRLLVSTSGLFWLRPSKPTWASGAVGGLFSWLAGWRAGEWRAAYGFDLAGEGGRDLHVRAVLSEDHWTMSALSSVRTASSGSIDR